MTTATVHDRSPLAEIRRLRAELSAALTEVTQLRAIVAVPDPVADPDYWRALFTDARRGEIEAAYQAGHDDGYAECAAAVKAVHHSLADELARQNEAERGRWIVRGEFRTRATFADPHPGDFTGGPVPSW